MQSRVDSDCSVCSPVCCICRLFLGDDQITFLVVHVGGFLLDLSVGFLLVLDSTRWAAFVLCGLFNAMNSRMFAIGRLTPYVRKKMVRFPICQLLIKFFTLATFYIQFDESTVWRIAAMIAECNQTIYTSFRLIFVD